MSAERVTKKVKAWEPVLLRGDINTPEVGWLTIAEVHVDRTYQRDIKEAKVERMVREFDPRQLTTIVVCRRADGTYWVIDGQHRLEMLRRLGKQVVYADVRDGLNADQEAYLFHKLNDGATKVGAWDKFRARLAYAEPAATAIERAVTKHGYHFDKHGTSIKGIAAVVALEYVYNRGGEHLVGETLDVISRVWRADAKALDGVVLEGTGCFLDSYREDKNYEHARLLDLLAAIPPVEVLQRSRAIKTDSGRAGTGSDYWFFALALADIYNGRRRAKLSGLPKYRSGKAAARVHAGKKGTYA